ncbi:MAG: UvrD-helicase domain-containing protein [Thiotrichales bacterium]|nr:UvrD-helicase domain-containing protein [Thiotrichales bacterium]
MEALNPNTNITVSASAGSGKTYLLVSRIIRLLLQNTSPNSIVAITFTRKAAGEMLERLNERLYELASIEDADLQLKLNNLGLDSSYCEQARLLYETLLLNPRAVKITTFHAFCHDLLQRFPLEANISPGFELLESSTLLKHQSWQRLLGTATKQNSSTSDINTSLDQLFKECSNPTTVEELLLNDFLEHRSDWWAFTEGQTDPVAFANQETRKTLKLKKEPLVTSSLSNTARDQYQLFSQLLDTHKTKTNIEFACKLNALLEHTEFDIDKLKALHAIFFTASGSLRKRSTSKAQTKSMGIDGEEKFLALHISLSEHIEELLDSQYREKTATLSHAWCTVGNALLSIFQSIKQEQNALDFSDLEWKVYQLLSDSEQSHWVQYKLDQRIDHILIDEFQDTNPTQWHMLYPLLDEITLLEEINGQQERSRSVFIVGDGKQSIYRFRRAAPDLFIASQAWLKQQPAKHHALRLDRSRRSSPAIINLVNQTFSDTPLGEKLIDYQQHDTVHQELWGHTELLPLIANESIEKTEDGELNVDTTLRNPLESPRAIEIDLRYQKEGELIAGKISQLIDKGSTLLDNGVARNIHYGDIMILVKKRRHVADYENALLAASIPFIGTQRKSLLSTLEIQDMLSLCNTLLTPHSNLALAIVLRSPIFSCSDEDLSALACVNDDKTLSWYARLESGSDKQSFSPALTRAHFLLKQWRQLIGVLPVHDLLDHIYHQGNIVARYRASFPSHYVSRVQANLTRFIELALEIDSGRYPSLQKFIYRLELLSKRNESPDESALGNEERAVRLLTIHSAKGLESPVVFIADSTNQEGRNRRHHTLINWPANKKRPDYFFISSMHRDSVSKTFIELDKQKDDIEDVNLLYVALTRARQYLYISGVEPRRGNWKSSWYGQISQQVDNEFDCSLGWSNTSGKSSQANVASPDNSLASNENKTENQTTRVDYSFSAASSLKQPEYIAKNESGDVDTLTAAYGETLHRLLELLSLGTLNPSQHIDEARRHFPLLPNNLAIEDCWQEALAVFTAPALLPYFDKTQFNNAHNEVSINALDANGRRLYGIIDRLIINDHTALIIDYKSRKNLTGDLVAIAEEYREQLSRYRDAAKILWPDKVISAAILFTVQQKLIELNF